MGSQNKSPEHVQRVRAIWRRVRESRGMSNVEFARELSQRLGFNIEASSASRWEWGTGEDRMGEVPSADKFLAVLEIGGYDVSPEGPTGGDQALRRQQMDLERQVRELTATVTAMASANRDEASRTRDLAALPRAEGTGFLSVTEAAQRRGVARKTIYDWIEQGRLPAYRRGAQRMVRLEDLDAVERRPPGPQT